MLPQETEDYKKVEKAIQFIENNFRSRPGLDEIAAKVHLSKFHFDRMFKRWAGISPMQFVRFMTLDYTKEKLARSQTLLDTALDAGLSGTGRLHDLFVTFDAMTPGEFKKQGRGLAITYGVVPSPFGPCLMAKTTRGICHLGFTNPDSQNRPLADLFKAWPQAEFIENKDRIQADVRAIFTPNRRQKGPFNLLLKGTNFQINVWKALLRIPQGQLVSYQAVAEYMGRPKAFRAVAGAIAANPVSYLIPCHRVIAKTGKIHQYRWGSTRKKAMIGWEAARTA